MRDEEWTVQNAMSAAGRLTVRCIGISENLRLSTGATARSSFHYVCSLPTVGLLQSCHCG